MVFLATGLRTCLQKFPLSAQQKYYAEVVQHQLQKRTGPYWLVVENYPIMIPSENLLFACEVAATFHNEVCFDSSDTDPHDYDSMVTPESSFEEEEEETF